MYHDDRLDAVRQPDDLQVSGNHHKKPRVSGACFYKDLAALHLAPSTVCRDARYLCFGKRWEGLIAFSGYRWQRDFWIRCRRLECLNHRRISSCQARHSHSSAKFRVGRARERNIGRESSFDVGETDLSTCILIGPLEREVGNLFPTLLANGVMRAVRKLTVIRDGRRILDVLAQVALVDGRWNDVIVAAGNEQERRTIALFVVD